MVRKLRSYTQEFKEESVQLALNYGNVHKAASELGMPAATFIDYKAPFIDYKAPFEFECAG